MFRIKKTPVQGLGSYRKQAVVTNILSTVYQQYINILINIGCCYPCCLWFLYVYLLFLLLHLIFLSHFCIFLEISLIISRNFPIFYPFQVFYLFLIYDPLFTADDLKYLLLYTRLLEPSSFIRNFIEPETGCISFTSISPIPTPIGLCLNCLNLSSPSSSIRVKSLSQKIRSK